MSPAAHIRSLSGGPRKGCNIVLVYLPGYANSAWVTAPGLGLEEYGDAFAVDYPDNACFDDIVDAVIDVIRGGTYDAVVLVGASEGAPIVDFIVQRIQLRGLYAQPYVVAWCGFSDETDLAVPVRLLSRWLRGPLVWPWVQRLARWFFDTHVAKWKPEPDIDLGLLRAHNGALAELPGSSRRLHLAFMAGLRRKSRPIQHHVRSAYVRAGQLKGSHDGFVKYQAADGWCEVYPDTRVFDAPELGHCTFVQQPQQTRAEFRRVMNHFGFMPITGDA